MMTIWKYEFPVTDSFLLDMPEGATILSVQTQNGTPCVWALVNPTRPVEPREFSMFGTGHDVPAGVLLGGEFVGTFQVQGGALVFHLFVRGGSR